MMKRFSLLLLILFIISSCSDQPYRKGRNSHSVIYRGQKPTPRVEMKKPTHSEIAQRITLAQGILESGSGQGRLARYGNNHFGIKCHATWNGKTITHDDDEKSECFRRYKYAYESFEDHSQFLVKRGRYSSLFELDPTDYESWAHGLKKAGYATDPAYAKKLIALIKKFNLHLYDNQVIAMKGAELKMPNTDVISTPTPKIAANETTQPAAQPVVKEIAKPVVKETPKVIAKAETPKAPAAKPASAPAKESPVKKEAIAQVFYQVQTGDTLYKIAREQQVPVQQLMKLNNFDDVASSNLKVGQQIRVN